MLVWFGVLIASLFAQPAGGDISLEYDFDLRHGEPSEVTIEIGYNRDAEFLLGPPDVMADGAFQDPLWQREDAQFVESTADASDPDDQRVTITGTADGPAAIQEVIRNDFYDVIVDGEDDLLEMRLAPGGDGRGFLEVDGLTIEGSVTITHDGARTSLSGGDEVDDQTINWDPFGSDNLNLAVDLSGESSAGDVDVWVILAVVVLLLMIGAGIAVALILRRRRRPREVGTGPLVGQHASHAGGYPDGDPPGAQNWPAPDPTTAGGGSPPQPASPPPPAPSPSPPPGEDDEPQRGAT